MAGAERDKDVVIPTEVKQEMLDQFARRGIKVEHKAPSLDLTYVLPGFLVAMLVLGLIYMNIPIRLSTETLSARLGGTTADKSRENAVDSTVVADDKED